MGVAVADVSFETNAKSSDIESFEYSILNGNASWYAVSEWSTPGRYVVHSKSGAPTYDEDVTVKIQVTFKNGRTATDTALLKIRNDKMYFSNMAITADENIPWDEFNHYAVLHLGVNQIIPRIRSSIKYSSSDESILKLTTSGIRQVDYDYKVKLVPQDNVGTVTITMKATDDSGVEQTVTKTITTYETT